MCLRLGFIGAGVVGTALGKLLNDRGYTLTGYYSRSLSSAVKAARATGSDYFENAAALLADTDTLFITTNDDAIAPVAKGLAARGLIRPGQAVVHCSGSLTLSALAPARESGARVLSVHPLQSCASVTYAVESLPNSVFSIEGEGAAREIGIQLVKALGGSYFFIDGEKKALYHAAAVVASNYLVTLIYLSKRLMLAAGMPEEQFVPALYPLIKGTLANIERLGIPEALTGPIARGDVETIVDHLHRMEVSIPGATALYSALGLETIDLGLAKGTLGEKAASSLNQLLKGGGKK